MAPYFGEPALPARGIKAPGDYPATKRDIEELKDIMRQHTEYLTGAAHEPAQAGKQPIPQRSPETIARAKFLKLAAQWREDTAFCSSVLEMATTPAYQQIIGMGRSALPHIFQELSKQPDHWFWALKAITCEDPVPDEDKGNLQRMTAAWLVWGARSGYVL